jgi:general secretion pathway protein A
MVRREPSSLAVNVSSSNPIAPEVYYRDKALLQCHVAYESFFGLKENPFSLTPDPRYLFRTRHAHETLRQLTRSILTRRGLILLSGEVGTGKTTLLNSALQVLKENAGVGASVRTAVLVHPTFTREEFVEAILNDFEVCCTATRKPRRLQFLQEMLLEVRRKGGVAVLAVDEAQLLTPELLDEIRELLGPVIGQEALLQIILCGQTDMEEKLNRSGLCRVQAPVTVCCKTVPLTLQDTRDYIEHRLRVAGAKSESIFTKDAADAVHHHSHGIPRVVNLLCGHALSTAGLRGVRHITSLMIEEASTRMPFPDGKPPGTRSRGLRSGNGSGHVESQKPLAPPAVPTVAAEPQGVNTAVPHAVRRAHIDPYGQAPEPAVRIGSPERLPFRGGGSKSPTVLHVAPWRRWLRFDFAHKKYSMFLCYIALIGALFLTLAQTGGAAWQHAARAAVGFLGLLLLDISLGLAAYRFLFEGRTELRESAAPAKSSSASYKRLYALVSTFSLASLRLARLGPRDTARRR